MLVGWLVSEVTNSKATGEKDSIKPACYNVFSISFFSLTIIAA